MAEPVTMQEIKELRDSIQDYEDDIYNPKVTELLLASYSLLAKCKKLLNNLIERSAEQS